MARPRVELLSCDALLALVDGEGCLAVRVTPGAKAEGLELSAGKLSVKVRSQPKDGKANEAVRELLARGLGVAPSRLSLLRGATSRGKLFRILP